MIDLRQLAIAKLWSNYNKKLNNEATKQALRNGEKTINSDYATITLDNYTKSYYSAEDQAKIDKFIADNNIKKITETKENYSVEIVPTPKAHKEFEKMIAELQDSNNRAIRVTASKVASAITKQ